MTNLKLFLQSMAQKTVFITVLLWILFALQANNLFDAQTTAWIEIACTGLLLFFKMFAPTGVLVKGWNTLFYVANGIVFLLQFEGVIIASGLIGAAGLAILAKVSVILNTAFSAIQLSNSKTALQQ